MAELQEIYVGQNVLLSAEDKELTFINGCMDPSSTNEIDAVLVYWSCLFYPASGISKTTHLPKQPSTDELARFYVFGMIHAKDRWEKKEIYLPASNREWPEYLSFFLF